MVAPSAYGWQTAVMPHEMHKILPEAACSGVANDHGGCPVAEPWHVNADGHADADADLYRNRVASNNGAVLARHSTAVVAVLGVPHHAWEGSDMLAGHYKWHPYRTESACASGGVVHRGVGRSFQAEKPWIARGSVEVLAQGAAC